MRNVSGLPVTVLPAGLPATFALPVVDVSTSFRNPAKIRLNLPRDPQQA